MPNNNETDVKFRQIDLSAEMRKSWGVEWNKPEVSYEFSSGRKFELRTEDGGVYNPTSS